MLTFSFSVGALVSTGLTSAGIGSVKSARFVTGDCSISVERFSSRALRLLSRDAVDASVFDFRLFSSKACR